MKSGMKLARPDIRHPRIVLAGSQHAESGDDAGLVAALRKRGLHARWMSWDDPDTLRADLVILRATTEYADQLDEFLAWTRRVPNLLNAPDVVAWNTDRRYLHDLRDAGVPTRGSRSSPSADQTALVFLGGAQSHAFVMPGAAPAGSDCPAPPQAVARPASSPAGSDCPAPPQAVARPASSPVEADFELWELGQVALLAAAGHLDIGADELLYARAEVIGGPGNAQLAALDLVAPSLDWRSLDDAARDHGQRQFALCVESALDRLGLGPLSHRRP
jgi:hypothetical protein